MQLGVCTNAIHDDGIGKTYRDKLILSHFECRISKRSNSFCFTLMTVGVAGKKAAPLSGGGL